MGVTKEGFGRRWHRSKGWKTVGKPREQVEVEVPAEMVDTKAGVRKNLSDGVTYVEWANWTW